MLLREAWICGPSNRLSPPLPYTPVRSAFLSPPLRFSPGDIPHYWFRRPLCVKPAIFNFRFAFLGHTGGGSNDNNNNGGNKTTFDDGDASFSFSLLSLLLLLSSASMLYFTLSAVAEVLSRDESIVVWEVRGLSKWTRFLADPFQDEFVRSPLTLLLGSETKQSGKTVALLLAYTGKLWSEFGSVFSRLLLPDGFPRSVTSDYLDYSLWRGVQGVASQISGVLATQALLYAVGLGKGAIPAAAAVSWVLKDGIGYLSKIMLSKFGRHFDVHPKGWRLFADLLENAAFGLEMLTPAVPQYFVAVGAVAGASRSAATLIQSATRSYFYAGFAAQRNFAEIIAKGEAQGMVSKFAGIVLGIALANFVGSSTSLALASFSVVAGIHMFCNVKSYQCVLLRTLNPFRASIVFSEYLLTGQPPPVKEVNDAEPLIPAGPNLLIFPIKKEQSDALTPEASTAAAEIEKRLQLGTKLSSIVSDREEAVALFNLYKDESYILVEHKGKFCVVMKEGCTPSDLLKSLFQVNYLYWLERFAGILPKNPCDDCTLGGRLQISLDYVQREFGHVIDDSSSLGWIVDGLIARPLPSRIRVVDSLQVAR